MMKMKTCTHLGEIKKVHPKDITVCEDCGTAKGSADASWTLYWMFGPTSGDQVTVTLVVQTIEKLRPVGGGKAVTVLPIIR